MTRSSDPRSAGRHDPEGSGSREGLSWGSILVTAVIAAVIALVIGTLCYSFLADQDWGEAAVSALPWTAVAGLGVLAGFIGVAIVLRGRRG